MENMTVLEKRDIQVSLKVSERVDKLLKELKSINGLSANDIFAVMAVEMLPSLIEKAKADKVNQESD
jgi:hypothetical protein